jgi:outer membrane protein TolC
MPSPRKTLVVAFVICLASLVIYGQDRSPAAPDAELRKAIERLEVKISRLEKELQQAREELARLKDSDLPVEIVPHPKQPYLRFPVEVERAMMGDALRMRPPIEGHPQRMQNSRSFKSVPQRKP